MTYFKYDLNKILSTQKSEAKKNLIKINEKYFFQVPNRQEKEVLTEECSYKFHVKVEEKDSYAKIIDIKDLLEICLNLEVEDQITASLIFQLLEFQEIDQNFMKYIQSEALFKNVRLLIMNHNKFVLIKAFTKLNKSYEKTIEFVNKYSQYFQSLTIFHKSIVEFCFCPINDQQLEEQIIKGEHKFVYLNSKNKLEFELFLEWIRCQDTKIIKPNYIFNQKFDLQQQDIWNSARVKEHLAHSINNFEVDQEYIKEIFQKYHPLLSSQGSFRFDEKHIINKKLPQIITQDFEDKIYIQVRLRKGKYRIAVKNQPITCMQSMFYTDLFKMNFTPQNYLLKQIINKIKNSDKKDTKNSNEENNKAYLYIDLKDFHLNVDYDLVEKLVNLPEIANYLRKRKIYFVNNDSTEVEIKTKKGIFIGEVFHTYILTYISEIIKKIINNTFEEHFSLSFNYLDDFFIELKPSNSEDKYNLMESLEQKLTKLENNLNKLGFTINKPKVQLLTIFEGECHAYNLKAEKFEFQHSLQFVLFGKDLLKNVKIENQEKIFLPKESIEKFLLNIFSLGRKTKGQTQIEYINKSLENKLTKLSQIQQFFALKHLQKQNQIMTDKCRFKVIQFLKKQLGFQNFPNVSQEQQPYYDD